MHSVFIFIHSLQHFFPLAAQFAAVKRCCCVIYCTAIYSGDNKCSLVDLVFAQSGVTAVTAVPPALLCLHDYVPKV